MAILAFGHKDNNIRSEKGFTVIEVLVALSILLVVFLMLYRIIIGGRTASTSAQGRMSALRFARMELEEVTTTQYDDLPPEKHTVLASIGSDRSVQCFVKLRHIPLKNSVSVWITQGEVDPNCYSIDYQQGIVSLPYSMNGKSAYIAYSYEYPRRRLVTIPKEAPYRIRIAAAPIRHISSVTANSGEPLAVPVNCNEGYAAFKAKDAGKLVTVLYRSDEDKGIIRGSFLANDLSLSTVDSGLKLISITESWELDGKKKDINLSYVRAE